MTTIYISDSGDDKNDGLSLQTAMPATIFYSVAPCPALLPLLRDGQE
jgi:hypothetical protein